MEKEKKRQYILHCKKAAEDATLHRRDAWRELWDLYQNKQDSTNKMPWQSRCFIPRIYMTVEQAASVIKRAVMSSKSLFSLETKDPDVIPQEQLDIIDRDFRDDLDESNFADVYGEQSKVALLLGAGVIKVYWDGGLKYDHIEIENVFVDPLYKSTQFKPPRYVIERKTMHLAEFKRMAEKINRQAGKDLYDMSVVKSIEEDFESQDKKAEENARKGYSEFTPINRRVEILEYWGDIIDDEAGTIEENRLIVVVNCEHVVRDQKNPFNHKRPAYIITVPVVYPHRGVAGISLVEPVVTVQYTLNNAVNMLLDNMNFSVNKAYEVNVNNVLNPQNLTQMYPGKLVKKNTSNPVIQEVKTSSVGQDAFTTVEMLHKFIEKGTAVTEFIEGSAGKTKTLGETQIKTAQAQGWFDTIARDLEKCSLAPLLRMSFSIWLQFHKEAKNLPKDIIDHIRFRVGGLTIMLRQQEQAQNISQALALSMKSPELNQLTNTRMLWKKLLSVWDLQDAYTEEPQAPTMDQRVQVEGMAAENAKSAVSQMSPDQKMQLAQRMGIGNEPGI